MSIAKRVLELPKNHPLRKEFENMNSSKKIEFKGSVKKGDKVRTHDGKIGIIIKYPSNKDIVLDSGDTISKEDIAEIVNG